MKLLSNESYRQQGYQLEFFYPNDTKELYEKNLKIQGPDWIWRNRPIRYTLNSQGFRCGEFDSIDWNNSIACFGCSNTFGIGIDDPDTWPHNLSLFLKIPVINLAQGGMGWDFNWVNSMRVMQAGYRPRAVVYYWPSSERMFTLPDSKNLNLVHGHGAWSIKLEAKLKDSAPPGMKLGMHWALDPLLGDFWSNQYKQSLDIMWASVGVPVHHYTWDVNFKILNVEHILLRSNRVDINQRARDIKHPGPNDCIRIAQEIQSRINLG